jgi:hypothetical protein
MDIFFLHLFASVRLDEADGIASNGSTISMSAGRFNPHGWSETPMLSTLLTATHVPGVAHSTTQALANMGSHSPKQVERWS